jgi:hypothetical protein
VTTAGFGAALLEANNLMFTTYNCKASVDRCSEYEIAVKQWYSSEITNKELAGFEITLTISDWFPSVFEVPFELSYFRFTYMEGETGGLTED